MDLRAHEIVLSVFAYCIKQLVDVHYPDCKKIALIMDNLNTHSTASLYDALPPAEALRLVNKLEIHHTPRHGSWLNMVEIETGVMSRQCLKGYLANKENVIKRVDSWCARRIPLTVYQTQQSGSNPSELCLFTVQVFDILLSPYFKHR